VEGIYTVEKGYLGCELFDGRRPKTTLETLQTLRQSLIQDIDLEVRKGQRIPIIEGLRRRNQLIVYSLCIAGERTLKSDTASVHYHARSLRSEYVLWDYYNRGCEIQADVKGLMLILSLFYRLYKFFPCGHILQGLFCSCRSIERKV
jgi:hypothetical protein